MIDAKRLRTVLRVRELKADSAALALAQARGLVRVAEAAREAMEDHQRRIVEDASTAQISGEPMRVPPLLEYERHLARRLVEQDARIVALERGAEAKRAEAEAKLKDQRVIERVLDRAAEERRAVVARADRKRLDEQSAMRAARTRASLGRRSE